MAIPKKLHFIWAGGPKLLPPENAKRIKAWAKKNPGFEVILWVDSKTTLPEELAKYNKDPYLFNNDPKIVIRDINNKDEGVGDEYSRYHIDKMMPNYGASSDILRYAILKKFGGAYFDSDVIVDDETKPLNHDGLFDSDRSEILKINQFIQHHHAIGNDGFICTPEHPMMTALYELAKTNHRDVTRKIYSGEFIYDYDSTATRDSGQAQVLIAGPRKDWTLGCTGPGAVIQVCKAHGLLEITLDAGFVGSKTSDPDFVLDTSCYKAAPRNDANWMRLKVASSDGDYAAAIDAAVRDIHFEAKHLGILALDAHIRNIIKSMEPSKLNEMEVASDLTKALGINPPDLTSIQLVQLLSIHPSVREYYKEKTPYADDGLNFLEGPFGFQYKINRILLLLSGVDESNRKKIIKDHAQHIIDIVFIRINNEPKNISTSDLQKLFFIHELLKSQLTDVFSLYLLDNIEKALAKVLSILIDKKDTVTLDQIKKILPIYVYENVDRHELLMRCLTNIKSATTNQESLSFIETMTEPLIKIKAKRDMMQLINLLHTNLPVSKITGLGEFLRSYYDMTEDNFIKELKAIVSPSSQHSPIFFSGTGDGGTEKTKQILHIIKSNDKVENMVMKIEALLVIPKIDEEQKIKPE